MKIILLSGKPNTGKTTTFNLLYNEITQNGTANIVVKKTGIDKPNSPDFECVLSYNNKTIALFSMGDVYGKFIDALIHYANCDILILAYSEKFYKKLDETIEKLPYHCVIRKTSLNAVDCKSIIAKL